MAACSSLQVILRVEVTVYENDRVSSSKVQAHSPCKEEAKAHGVETAHI